VTPALEKAYAQPHRRYHTRRHIEVCLELLATVDGLGGGDHRALERAIWWHDAVYDPRRSDNEAMSAALAERDLAAVGVPAPQIAEVARLIRLTAAHHAEPGDRLGALMISIDLAILGAADSDYDAYARAVRAEYAHLPPQQYRAGRRRVLEALLASDPLFPDEAFHARFEAAARANLVRELKGLG